MYGVARRVNYIIIILHCIQSVPYITMVFCNMHQSGTLLSNHMARGKTSHCHRETPLNVLRICICHAGLHSIAKCCYNATILCKMYAISPKFLLHVSLSAMIEYHDTIEAFELNRIVYYQASGHKMSHCVFRWCNGIYIALYSSILQWMKA